MTIKQECPQCGKLTLEELFPGEWYCVDCDNGTVFFLVDVDLGNCDPYNKTGTRL